MRWRAKTPICFWLSYVLFLPSVHQGFILLIKVSQSSSYPIISGISLIKVSIIIYTSNDHQMVRFISC